MVSMSISKPLSLVAFLALAACQYKIVTPDSGPPVRDAAAPVGDATCGYDAAPLPEPSPYMADDAWCPLAQERLLRLCCRDPYGRLMGARNVDGEEFAAVCKDLETRQGIPLNAKCTAKAPTCEEAKRCTRQKQ